MKTLKVAAAGPGKDHMRNQRVKSRSMRYTLNLQSRHAGICWARIKLPATAWLFSLLLSANSAAMGGEVRQDVPRLSVDQVKQMLGNPEIVIIDVRQDRSWWRSNAKIPTSSREDPSQVDQWEHKYPKAKTLIFYCA